MTLIKKNELLSGCMVFFNVVGVIWIGIVIGFITPKFFSQDKANQNEIIQTQTNNINTNIMRSDLIFDIPKFESTTVKYKKASSQISSCENTTDFVFDFPYVCIQGSAAGIVLMNLKKVPSEIFSRQSKLNFLICSYLGDLVEFPDPIYFPYLIYLKASSCFYGSIPTTIGQLSYLRALYHTRILFYFECIEYI
eukprot:c4515_g1_i1.p1 GENE.c4515_g1_i1~~c4515_g1_i1.p1  ORF type:complete len:194 (+),score=23.82 c4515_g1_i1:39-620(+)